MPPFKVLKSGFVPKVCEPGLVNVMVCVLLGVTVLELAEAAPVPALLVAVTVKVWSVPLVSEETVIVQADGPAQLPVLPPGLEVAV